MNSIISDFTEKCLVVIPARMKSSRLPGKPMLRTMGKPLVHWTYEQAKKSIAERVVVASSDVEILDYCVEHGLDCVKTGEYCLTGSLRCRDAYIRLKSAAHVLVNWQCDEPLMDPGWVDVLIHGKKV